MNTLQVKICGLTDPLQAKACADLGANALGLIFYPKSPRHVNLEQARRVVGAVEMRVPVVGVFVDQDPRVVAETAMQVGISWVQLHGQESPQQVQQLVQSGLKVIKVLRSLGHALEQEALQYTQASAFLVEAGHGVLPGGNGAQWNWAEAQVLADMRPFALAGGLNADNVQHAAQSAQASLLDLSSGVETQPGIKDLAKVEAVLRVVRNMDVYWNSGVVIT